MYIREILDVHGLDSALLALRELPETEARNVRHLLLELVQPAAQICVDSRVREGLEVARAYIEGRADAAALKAARQKVLDAAWGTQYDIDKRAAWAVVDALDADPARVAVSAAWEAASSVAHKMVGDDVPKGSEEYRAAFKAARESVRAKQAEIVRAFCEKMRWAVEGLPQAREGARMR